jgi:hypothetical protein
VQTKPVLSAINALLQTKMNKTTSVACSPEANYTEGATATVRRIIVPTFADRGVSRGQRDGPSRPLISVF